MLLKKTIVYNGNETNQFFIEFENNIIIILTNLINSILKYVIPK